MNPADRTSLRRELRDRRRALPAPRRIAAAEALAERMLASPLLRFDGHLAGYWAMDGEIGLHALQMRLPPGIVYCLPLLHDDGVLRFAPWRPGDALVTNRYGIPEPDVDPDRALEADALAGAIVPLVGFDEHGRRLGMGGGWYDRTFAFRKRSTAGAVLLGAAFDLQRVDAIEPEEWDVPLDAVFTEVATYSPTVRPGPTIA